jgi:hypothetical protein
MLRLPNRDSHIRELFDMNDLVSLASPENRMKLPTFREALVSAKRTLAGDKAIRAVHTLTLRANGELWLMKVGPRGGWKVLWNFGQL